MVTKISLFFEPIIKVCKGEMTLTCSINKLHSNKLLFLSKFHSRNSLRASISSFTFEEL